MGSRYFLPQTFHLHNLPNGRVLGVLFFCFYLIRSSCIFQLCIFKFSSSLFRISLCSHFKKKKFLPRRYFVFHLYSCISTIYGTCFFFSLNSYLYLFFHNFTALTYFIPLLFKWSYLPVSHRFLVNITFLLEF